MRINQEFRFVLYVLFSTINAMGDRTQFGATGDKKEGKSRQKSVPRICATFYTGCEPTSGEIEHCGLNERP